MIQQDGISVGLLVHEYTQTLTGLAQGLTMDILKIGEKLYNAKHELIAGRYLHQWNNFDKFGDYISAPVESGGCGISRRLAMKALKIYETLVVNTKLEDLSVLEGLNEDSLYLLTKVVKKSNIEEWIIKARSLTLDHLALEIEEAKGEKQASSEIVRNIPWDILPRLILELLTDIESTIPEGDSPKDYLRRIKRLELRRDLEEGYFFWKIEKI